MDFQTVQLKVLDMSRIVGDSVSSLGKGSEINITSVTTEDKT
jgi:hypothetical protein